MRALDTRDWTAGPCSSVLRYNTLTNGKSWLLPVARRGLTLLTAEASRLCI